MIGSLLIALTLAQSASPPVANAAISDRSDEASLPAIVARGQLLYLLDQAAWHSTDVMLKTVRDPGAAGVRGWIVEPGEKTLRVTYYGLAGTQAVPVYVADFAAGRVSGARLIPQSERRPLNAYQQRMVVARTAGAGGKLEPCVAKPFNTVVVPPPGAGAPIEVYYLTPPTKARSWPVGRHYRLLIAPDGRVADTRSFSRTCLELGTAGLPKGAKPVALFVNHILGPVPTETHVFTALSARIPLVVQTGKVRWWVDGRTAIRRMTDNELR